MGWYYTRLLSYAFRGLNSKISLVHNCLHTNPIVVKNNSNSPFVRLVSYNSRINRGLNSQKSTSCVTFVRRLHCGVDGSNVHLSKLWGLGRRICDVTSLTIIGSLGFTLMFVADMETVPYTNRRHLVLFPSSLEKRIAEWLFEKLKRGKYEGRILPPSHPDNIRVQKMAKDIIGATRRVLSEDCHRGAQTSHVEEFNWEVIVVENPNNAHCYPAYCYIGGKIVVNSGTPRFSKCDDDAELALLIGHEVAHAVARHQLEVGVLGFLPGIMLFSFLPRIMLYLSIPTSVVLHYFAELCLSRRNEGEADYIGLLLGASAGYDPRIVAKKYERHLKTRTPVLEEYTSVHPPIEQTAQLFTHPEVKEKALSIYKEGLSRSHSKIN